MKLIFSLYSPKLPIYLVYMFQQVEYRPVKFIEWLGKLSMTSSGLRRVMYRQSLDYTLRAKMLVSVGYVCLILPIIVGFLIFGFWQTTIITRIIALFGFVIFVPVIVMTGLATIVTLAYYLLARPRELKLIAESYEIFSKTKALKIAVAGSYGKTTMKELLATVLSEKFKVALTPGNKNTPTAHAIFANQLDGDEDILLIEYGEGRPGDIGRFVTTTEPDYAIITGLAPNHLDYYKSMEVLAKDIFCLREFVEPDKLFIANNSDLIREYIKVSDITFMDKSALDYKISDVKLAITGTSFSMSRGKIKLNLHSGLLGAHQVAPLAFVTAFALELGMNKFEVQQAIMKTIPFEHRMQPYQLGGAWIIDDTYNGNLEGVRAGLNLLIALPAKRKIYVTPGLVDQGEQTEQVHQEISKLITKAKPNKLILIDNSATKIIKHYLDEYKYSGDIIVESDPLDFYQNLDQFVARGDLIMMQNDWTDNYI